MVAADGSGVGRACGVRNSEVDNETQSGSDRARPEALRIAFATSEYVTEKYFDGGLANYTHRIAKALAGMGHDVHVLTLSEIDETEFEHEGVTVHRVTVGDDWHRFNRLTQDRLLITARYLCQSLRVYRELKRLNARRPFHLVQFPNWSCCGLVSMCLLRVPYVLRASSYQPVLNDRSGAEPNLDARAVERLEGLQFRLSRYVYAPSHTLRRTLAEEAGVRGVRVIPSPSYVETPDWDRPAYAQSLEGKKYLLFFGRFQLHKGFDVLARALPRVLERFPDAHAVLVGRDMWTPLAPSMADYARFVCGGFAERLIIMKKLPHRQLYPVIAGAHLIVLPSLVDNLPNACLEAMALGKVVIGTVGTSFDELIDDGATGFLVAPSDAGALAEKIISAWEHPKLREMGEAAREKIMEFSPGRTVESLLAYYGEVLRG